MEEEWKDIKNFEGLYQISNLGNVRSVEHFDSNGHRYAGKLLKLRENEKYYRVHLSNGKIAKYYLVHRLVAEAFCRKKDGCNIVNHLDCNTHNNRYDNLEWTTYKGNMEWASKLGRMQANEQAFSNILASREKIMTAVIATDELGNEQLFESQSSAAKKLGISHGHIAAACRKEYGYKTINGYSFRYADSEKQSKATPKRIGKTKEELSKINSDRMKGNKIMEGRHLSSETKSKISSALSKPVCQYSKDGTFLAEYKSASSVRSITGIVIDSCLSGKTKTAGGYVWKYKEKK